MCVCQDAGERFILQCAGGGVGKYVTSGLWGRVCPSGCWALQEDFLLVPLSKRNAIPVVPLG